MKLYIDYTYKMVENYHSGEQYGDWYEKWDFEINSVFVRQPKSVNRVETLDVDYEVSVGERVYVLYMRYSSGDSFGRSSGNAEIIWVFKSKEVAEATKVLWENIGDEWGVETVTDSGKSLKLSNPAAGYFENVSSINLETYIVES